jgi:hypothetical protein
LALASASAFAEAPVIVPPPDVIIGDLEQGDGNNVFIFLDAIDLDAIVSDDNTADGAIKWSYISSDTNIVINGAAQLSGVDPNAPLAGENIRGTNADQPGSLEDGAANTITFRNQNLSAGLGSLGPYADPGTTGIIPAETRTITLYASDCSTYSQVDIVVYTANSTSDSLSGGSQLENIIDLDFENDPTAPSGWFGGTLAGMGTTSIATGLCMTVPFGIDSTGFGSTVGWLSPPNFTAPGPNFVPLVDKGLYRCTLTLWTNTTVASGIPYVDWVWSNTLQNVGFPASTVDGNNYGGLYWLLDVAGGATGIGRYQPPASGGSGGTSDFNVWITPNCALTDQWRGVIDAANSGFDPSVDFKNDFGFTLRILHDNTAILTQNDGGTICLRRLRVDRTSLDTITRTPIVTAPIQAYNAGGIHFRDPDDFGTPAGGSFVIDNANNVANLTLTPNPLAAGAAGVGARRKLVFFDTAQSNINTQVYPILWEQGKLYMTSSKIRSNVGGPSGTTEGTDPLDSIFVDFSVPTSEVGSFHFSDRGSAGNMLRAASPRLLATTGKSEGEEFIGFFEGTYPSRAEIVTGGLDPTYVDADRIRGYIDFFNTGNIIGTTTDGLDPFTVETLELFEVTY